MKNKIYPPFIMQESSLKTLMLDFIIALVPALVWAVYIFGFRVLTLVAVTVVSSVLFECVFRIIVKRENKIPDLYTVVLGILTAFTLPVSTPLWVAVIAAFIVVIPLKELLALKSRNIINPVLGARLILAFALSGHIDGYVAPLVNKLSAFSLDGSDIVACATPLTSLREGSVPDAGIFDMFIGNIAGAVGEVSAMLLLIGGLYLVARRVISWHIPTAYLATVAVLCHIFPQSQSVQAYEFMLMELCSGGLILAALFLATDTRYAPVTANGRIIYGAGCGVLTVVIRYFVPIGEGVALAVVIMNLLSRIIDKLTRPKPFGYVPEAKNK